MYTPAESVPIRIAALRGIITVTPQKGTAHIVDALKGDDRQMQSMVIGLLRDIPGTKTTKAITAELPNLSVSGQVQLLSALAGRGDKAALPTVLDAAKSPEVDVRVAALGTLGALGDASAVDLLAKTAATTTGPEREAARNSLYRLSTETLTKRFCRVSHRLSLQSKSNCSVALASAIWRRAWRYY